MGVHWKILFLEGGFRKNQYVGGLPKKGAWAVCIFKNGLGKKKGLFLKGELIPQYTVWF